MFTLPPYVLIRDNCLPSSLRLAPAERHTTEESHEEDDSPRSLRAMEVDFPRSLRATAIGSSRSSMRATQAEGLISINRTQFGSSSLGVHFREMAVCQ